MRASRGIAGLTGLAFLVALLSGCQTPNQKKDYTAEINAIRKGADRLLSLQHSDGGFTWYLPGDASSDPTVSYPNMYGVVGLGLLDAYKVTNDSKYLDGAKKTADHLLTLSDDSVYASDTEFLAQLGKTILGSNNYSAKANEIMTHFLTGPNYITSGGPLTAVALDAHYQAVTPHGAHPNDLQGMAEWMLADWLRGMQLTGHASFAIDLIAQMNNDMSGTSPYFDTTNTSQSEYILGLSSELAATGNSGVKQKLIAAQKSDGSWEDPNGVVQDTAYAVMALVKAGSMDSAYSGVKAGMNHQSADGGFIETDGKDYLEADSEAIQGIYDYITQNP